MFKHLFAVTSPAVLAANLAYADPPVIEGATLSGNRIDVTVRHPDSGWDHYANVWRVYLPDETLLAERVLLHPHETEQPFTRSTNISVPESTTELIIVAECTDGDQSEPFILTLDN